MESLDSIAGHERHDRFRGAPGGGAPPGPLRGITVLRPLTAAREAAALETAWARAQSPATSLYPSFADGVKTQSEFFRAASLRNAAPGEALAGLVPPGKFRG